MNVSDKPLKCMRDNILKKTDFQAKNKLDGEFLFLSYVTDDILRCNMS